MKHRILVFSLLPLLWAGAGLAGADVCDGTNPNACLGKWIFFDTNLSINGNQSCATCHAPGAGWTGPDVAINAGGAVYEGSIPGRFGNRKPPSAAYATPSPIFHYTRQGGGMFVGGNFWDGRATGERLGNPAADQAQGPFLNPLEQALPSAAEVVDRVCDSAYGDDFRAVWGRPDFDPCDPLNAAAAYDAVALSIAAYEASPEVNAFSSKCDAYLARRTALTAEELQGLQLFNGKAKCARCHVNKGARPLFTDYTFDNLGVPRNPANPFYANFAYNLLGAAWIDTGLGGFLSSREDYAALARVHYGKHKVPTLRNVDQWDPLLGDKVKAYGHNGFFKSLWSIVHFYNTRDVLPVCPDSYTEEQALADNCWPLPELALNMNARVLGNLGLTEAEEWALVAFLTTLTDGWTP